MTKNLSSEGNDFRDRLDQRSVLELVEKLKGKAQLGLNTGIILEEIRDDPTHFELMTLLHSPLLNEFPLIPCNKLHLTATFFNLRHYIRHS